VEWRFQTKQYEPYSPEKGWHPSFFMGFGKSKAEQQAAAFSPDDDASLKLLIAASISQHLRE